MYSSFGDDVGVQSVAEVNGVDVVAVRVSHVFYRSLNPLPTIPDRCT